MAAASEKLRLTRIYLMEGLGGVAANLLTIGVFFYTKRYLPFTSRQNLVLSACIGGTYVVAALLSHRINQWLGAKRALIGTYFASLVVTLTAAFLHEWLPLCGLILAFVFFNTLSWPILEHLVAKGNIDGRELSRRITLYNLTWSGVGAVTIALGGSVIQHFPIGIFIIPTASCLIAMLVAMVFPVESLDDGVQPHSAVEPELALARQRTLAMRLARISVPAMYVVTYALAAMMPSILVLQQFDTTQQTLLSSVWPLVRFLTFVVLGAATFWHARPRLLLLAGVGLLVSFVLIVVPLTDEFGANITLMLAGQVLLGASSGLIYMCSLYFGMVLTAGSAQSSGYHEALIGLGMMLGPSAAAIVETISPGNQRAAVTAVNTIIALTLIYASVTSLRLRRTRV